MKPVNPVISGEGHRLKKQRVSHQGKKIRAKKMFLWDEPDTFFHPLHPIHQGFAGNWGTKRIVIFFYSVLFSTPVPPFETPEVRSGIRRT